MNFMNLASAQSVAIILILIFAYFFSVIIGGIGQILLRKAIGDQSLAGVDILELSPFYYIDMAGFFCLIVMTLFYDIGIGWGKVIPVIPEYIQGRWRGGRIILAFAAESIMNSILMLTALILLIVIAGPYALSGGLPVFFGQTISLEKFAKFFPEYSSLAITGILFLIAIIFLNIFIASWSIILNVFRYIMTVKSHHHFIVEHGAVIEFWGPLVTLIIFADVIRALLLGMLVYAAHGIAILVGGV